MHSSLFLLLITLLLLLTTSTTAMPKLGVTFDTTTPNLPPFPYIITSLIHNKISTVRLINPTPSSISSFSNTNISLLISIPNTFIHSFATDNSSSTTWITTNILPFHKTTRISLITIDSTDYITRFHLYAVRNLYEDLQKLVNDDIRVSITFPFNKILFEKDWITPSQSHLYFPELMRDLVRFLKSIDSPLLVAVYPYHVIHRPYYDDDIPVEFALFENYRINMRTDVFTGIEYWNLFDMMVDALGFALDTVGEGDVRVIVAETGWPGETIVVKNDTQWAPSVYLNGLMEHLKKLGSNIRVDEVYVYELFGDKWGIMDKEMRLKYKGLDFEVHEVTNEFVYKLVFSGLLLVIVGVVLRKVCGLKLLKVQ